MSEPSVICVVCGMEIHPFRNAPHYANAYEKIRKKAPCCSAACAAKFNPDEHWLPAELPRTLEGTEHDRLLLRTRKRLVAGDLPRDVIREALLGGIPAATVRLHLAEIIEARERHVERQETEQMRRGVLTVLFSAFLPRKAVVRGVASRSTDDTFDPKRLAEARADLDAWERALERVRSM